MNSRFRRIVFIVALILTSIQLFVLARAADPTVLDFQVEAKTGENFDYASAQLWAPAPAQPVRGVLCLILHPLDFGSATLAHPEPWINFATKKGCALLAISFAQSTDTTADWCLADHGTGRALLSALDGFADETGISSLKTAPLTVMGVCAAGQYAYYLAAFAPARVTGFVTIGGGRHDLASVSTAVHASALIVVTTDRPMYAVKNLDALYAAGRSHSAPWSQDTENMSYYDSGNCSNRVLSFLESSLDSSGSASAYSVSGALPPEGLRYLPISICGEKLPILAEVAPESAVLTASGYPSQSPPSCSFEVISLKENAFNEISVPTRDAGLHVKVHSKQLGRWQVECTVDQEQLPIGSSKLEIPFRFLRDGHKILGGTNATLTCEFGGDVSCLPSHLLLGTVKPGNIGLTAFHLASKSRGSIVINSIHSTYPWIQMKPGRIDGDYLCMVSPPRDFVGQGFAGYFDVTLSSPVHRSLRIFYYGALPDRNHSQNGTAESNPAE